ncbi:MAG TPA: hypothetical protein VIW67_22235 [Terriglobales bacterium]
MQPEAEPMCYTLSTAKLQVDGAVVVKVGGLSRNELWDGTQKFGPGHPDYGFWKWIIKKQFKAVVDTSGLKELRARFEKQVQ